MPCSSHAAIVARINCPHQFFPQRTAGHSLRPPSVNGSGPINPASSKIWIALSGQNHFFQSFSEGDALGYYGTGFQPVQLVSFYS
jgi:hypothetical protein